MGIEPTLDLIGPTTALKTAGNTSHQSPPHNHYRGLLVL